MIKVYAVSPDGALTDVEVNTTVFPGGEVHVSVGLDIPADALRLHAHLSNAEAVMALLLVTDAVRRAYPGRPLDLHMPYVPYARQDRVANPGESLSAKVFCELINAQGYRQVVIQDPHSDVVPALLDRVVIDDPLPALRKVLAEVGPVALVAPDAGARKRVLKLAQQLGCDVVFADKVRDTRTGAITGTQVLGLLPDQPLLVVDDICDGGRTFTELATVLRAQQLVQDLNAPLYLYVTHGVFSKGLDPLLAHFQKLFTRNNWISDLRCAQV
ncbi:ribose-phosphate diphosphokinase [Chitinimonas taiwanensis]|uniref:ribose-phosphate diphosphokinase n=1 Tax=Chitinimonas taiwanensis TaxID=240412 RepID=UPI0035B0AAE3